jgi:hypothetical protein
MEIVWSKSSRSFFVLNTLWVASKFNDSLLHGLDAESIILISLFEFGQDLCFRFLEKTIISDYESLLEQQ